MRKYNKDEETKNNDTKVEKLNQDNDNQDKTVKVRVVGFKSKKAKKWLPLI